MIGSSRKDEALDRLTDGIAQLTSMTAWLRYVEYAAGGRMQRGVRGRRMESGEGPTLSACVAAGRGDQGPAAANG
jgi:hypothetical protein